MISKRISNYGIQYFVKKIDLCATSNVNEVQTQQLHKPVIETFKRREVYDRFKDNNLAANLAEMV